MTSRPRAGDNEQKFRTLFESKAPGIQLLGKRRFESDYTEISVDQSFEYEGTEFLVEVDSANMAKLLVGQYVLLNQLRAVGKDAFFLVVHSYKKYNPMRTVHNLQLVNEQLYGGSGIPFGAVHFDALASWEGGMPGLVKLLTVPNPAVQGTLRYKAAPRP
jgi:hypothetical protein